MGNSLSKLAVVLVSMGRRKEEIALRTEVEVSPQFFGWLAGLGDKVRIQAPADVAESYREYLRGILARYEDV